VYWRNYQYSLVTCATHILVQFETHVILSQKLTNQNEFIV